MRCFVAIPLPEDLCFLLKDFSQKFSFRGVKLVHHENMHLTLFFLGDVKNLDVVISKLRSVNFKSFKLKTTKQGFFRNEKDIRSLWLGVDNSEELFSFWAELNKIFCQERVFIPHITFARVKFVNKKDKQLLLDLLKNSNLKEFSFKVNSFKLYSSELTEIGPVHRVIESFSLNQEKIYN